MSSVIFDFESLSSDPVRACALNMALLSFDEERLGSDNPYTYDELLDNVKYIKFDVAEQVKKYNREIQDSTLAWWSLQPKDAQKVLKPSSEDRSISELYDFLIENVDFKNLKMYYTRGNNFDPVIMSELLYVTGKHNPFVPFWIVRDMRSLIQGMTYGHGIKNTFIPEIPGIEEKFVKHDCRHDVVMDIMRYQFLAQLLKD